MTETLRISLAQFNPTVGDVAGNADLVRKARKQAAADKADLVMMSELFLCGYPPEDLVLKPAFQQACRAAAEQLAAETADGGPAVLLGTPWVEEGKLYNAVALLDGGKVAATRFKADLPNYGVFDEKRVFAAGPPQGPVNFRGVRLGIMVCEDMWQPEVSETLECWRRSVVRGALSCTPLKSNSNVGTATNLASSDARLTCVFPVAAVAPHAYKRYSIGVLYALASGTVGMLADRVCWAPIPVSV